MCYCYFIIYYKYFLKKIFIVNNKRIYYINYKYIHINNFFYYFNFCYKIKNKIFIIYTNNNIVFFY